MPKSPPPLARAVMVHAAPDVALALRVAAEALPPGTVLPLLSAPGAAYWLSPGLFLAMVARGAAGSPVPHLAVLDCGEAAGHALAALRAGCPALVLAGGSAAFPALAGAAAEAGARLWAAPPEALDMAGLRIGAPGAALRLHDWLRG